MLSNITIKKRLQILTGFMCLVILLLGYLASRAINNTTRGIDSVYQGGLDAVGHLNSLETALTEKLIIPLQKHRNGQISASEVEPIAQSWIKAKGLFEKDYIRNYSVNPIYQYALSELQSDLKTITESLQKQFENSRSGNRDSINQFVDQELVTAADRIIKSADQLIQQHLLETKQDYELAINHARSTLMWMIGCAIFSIACALIFGKLVMDSIITPLNMALSTVEQVALGNASIPIVYSGQDEPGQLMRAMQKMNDSTLKMTGILAMIANGDLSVEVPIRSENDTLGIGLKHMVERIKQAISVLEAVAQGNLSIPVPIRSQNDSFGKSLNFMVERLKQMISETQNEVDILTNSTQEIVSSINLVSTGTAETAAAVTETTTTVEELKQTAHISSDKAKDVLNNAEETLKIVKHSEKTLHQTIDEMNQIQEKMRIISDSILKLGEHSMTIREIIDTVNNLAEQSNLLAVNAAIEAAKAGDQGKSFGVVAQEIRTLAEQSKEATVQVKAILNDIQNAASAAVLATEQGSKAVSKGVLQSAQMSESIHTLSSSISRVAQAANQITISSQQQLIGVDQVTVAMTNINEASNQHVDHIRQIEATVGKLNEVALSLKNLVDVYQISQSDETQRY